MWPLAMEEVLAARRRISAALPPTPLRRYRTLEEVVGHDVEVWVKHENHQPTGAFKVRNTLAVVTSLERAALDAGLVAATRGNHGQGLAWAAARSGTGATLFVPHGNSPEKNTSMRALGGEVVELGATYDEAAAAAATFAQRQGATLVHSTNHPQVLAGAATLTLEMVEEVGPFDALILSVGGGSQAVGALTVTRALSPRTEVWGVQAAAAPTLHDSWHAGAKCPAPVGHTLADGLATGDVYELTFGALRDGLAGFVTVEEAEIAAAIRALISTTHNLSEGAGATGLAGLLKLRERFAGRRVGIVLSGGNIDRAVLARVLAGEV